MLNTGLKKYIDLRSLLFSFAFIIAFILPLRLYLFCDSSYSIDIDKTSSELISVKNNIISQNQFYKGSIKNFGVYLVTDIKDISENTEFYIHFTQNSNTVSCVLPVSKIKSNSINYVVPPLKGFYTGSFSVSFDLRNGLKNDVFVAKSMDEKSGLEGCIINNVPHKEPIVIQYSYFNLTSSDCIGAILFVLLCIIAFIIPHFINNELISNTYLAVITIIIITFIICIRQPVASYFGEPRSEAAYDFWQKAHDNGFWKSLFLLENNLYYLSFLQRIVAWSADILSPSSKYVFVIMQLFQTFFIAISCTLVYSNKLFVKLDRISKFFISISLGTLLVPLSMYFFHFLGYWGILFILLISLFDLKKISNLSFIGICFLSLIICLSKMIYVVLIPFCFAYFLCFNKKLAKKQIIFLGIILLGCIIQVAYTFIHTPVFSFPKGALGTIAHPSVLHLLNGLFYYAVQGINTFLFNRVHKHAFLFNTVEFILLLFIISYVCYSIIRKQNIYMKMIFALGMCYFSIFGFLMIASGGGINMLSSINWKTNILLVHPHFMFVKIILLLIAVLSSCVLIKYTRLKYFIFGIILWESIIAYPQNTNFYTSSSRVSIFPTEWRKVYQIVRDDFYYLPINVEYQFAGISLTKNASPFLYGLKLDGQWGRLQTGECFNTEYKFSSITIPQLHDKECISVSVRKANAYLNSIYSIKCFDKNKKIIYEGVQANSFNRHWIDFLFRNNISEIDTIEFYDNNTGNPAYVCGELNIGISSITYRKLAVEEINQLNDILKSNKMRDDITFSLEFCNNQLVLGTNTLIIENKEREMTLKGWVGGWYTGERIKKCIIKYGNSYYSINHRINRPDVVQATGFPELLQVGFSSTLPVQNNEKFISFILIAENNSFQIVDYLVEYL